ncbi:molybdenum cofactor guanylyltransferase [Leptolyngbya sp. PCC 6406]|uniref:molybdenum cofactor guanylyltransferase n=1 Tax=Leptolyngbya sp. PCC 6406 TaxID=1173264 RepID=UPI0002AC6461|nr:molybdenum cofactor guanylyltransferase [Leptolyngbya sp. PCC 6406]
MTLAAVILAGGHSRRMGQDKALLPRGDRPLIHHLCTVAAACTPTVGVITPWPDRYRSHVPAAVNFIPEPATPERSPGPLVALSLAWATVTADWLLLLACDLPNLEASVLQTWSQQLDSLPPEVIAYLPRHPQGWEPLCGFYRQTCKSALKAAIADGTRSFQKWLANQPVVAIPQVPSGLLLNCNTPENWQQFSTPDT